MSTARSRSPVRTVVGVVGEIVLSIGLLVLLFVVWLLWWTNVVAGRAQDRAVEEFERDVAEGKVFAKTPAKGDVFSVIRIPRLGSDYVRPIVEGTDAEQLAQGVGHYPTTAQPGQIGNFAVAGHRITHNEPFARLLELQTDDLVVIETAKRYFVYRVTETDVVDPTEVSVIAPVPDHPDKKPTKAIITMTTCHPRFEALWRYVVHGLLVDSYSRAKGLPPGILDEPGGS